VSAGERSGDCGELGVVFFMTELLASSKKCKFQVVSRNLVDHCTRVGEAVKLFVEK